MGRQEPRFGRSGTARSFWFALIVVIGLLASGGCAKQADPSNASVGTLARPRDSAPAGAGTSAPAAPTTAPANPTPKGMYATPAAPGEIIDDASAREVFNTYWPIHAEGFNDANPALIGSVETGTAALWDAVACVGGCGARLETVKDVRFTAPPQSAYPAYFAAQASVMVSGVESSPTGDTVDSYLTVFTRESAEAPWLATLTTGYSGATSVIPEIGPIVNAPPKVSGSIDPRDLPQRLAEYFDAYKRDGRPPADSPFSDSGGPAERGRLNAETHERLVAKGVADDTSYLSGVADDGFYEFWAGPTTVLACSTIRWTTTNEPMKPGGAITVTKDDDIFPAIVPPGRYARIERDGVRQVCFTYNDDCSCLSVAGFDGGNYVVRTTPA